MTPRQWLLSVLIVWHVTAVLVRALPDSRALPAFAPRPPIDGWRGVVTTGLDAVAAVGVPVIRAIGDLVRPVRPAFDTYIQLTGLAQTWAMFGNPPRVDQYLRVRHYVQPHEGRSWSTTHLVWPAHREDQVRLLQSFRDSYLDKTFAVATDEFVRHRRPDLLRPDTRPQELPDDLAPIARYYARVFARHLRSGDRVVRTEIWVGEAPNTPPGGSRDHRLLDDRRAALRAYDHDMVEQRPNAPPFPPYHAAEREADIRWLLEYYDEW